MIKPRLVVAPGLPRAVFDSLPQRFDAIGGVRDKRGHVRLLEHIENAW